MKGNKGITLIALVITIIVLLILAGVSIAMLSGDNSLLGRASSTVSANELAEGKDQVSLAWNAAYADYLQAYYGGTTNADLGAKFKDKLDAIANSYTFTLTVPSNITDDSEITVKSKSDTTKTVKATVSIDAPASGTTAASSGSLTWGN